MFAGLFNGAIGFVVVLVVIVGLKMLYRYTCQMKARAQLGKQYLSPPIEFFWGNAMTRRTWKGRQPDMHTEFIEKYCVDGRKAYALLGPSVVRGLGGSLNEIVTKDAGIVKHVLSDRFDTYAKSNPGGRMLTPFTDWLGAGIFLIDHGPHAECPSDEGRLWQIHRRTGAAIFTRDLFKNYYEKVFVDHTAELITVLQEKVGLKGENPVDLQFYMNAITMDCFGMIAFGAQLGNVSGADTAFGTAFDNAHSYAIDYIPEHLKHLLLLELLPTGLSNVLRTCVLEPYFSSSHRKLRESLDVLDGKMTEMIEAKRAGLSAEGDKDGETTEDRDLLGMFIKMQEGSDAASASAFSDKALRDMIMNFMLAGRDTTASTLSWIFYELGLKENREVLEEVQREVDDVLEGGTISFNDLQSLPYLRGVIWEALRLHPIVPIMTVTSKVDDVLPDGTDLPKGTRVLIANYAIGRDKERWGDDALEFKPTRWIPFTQPSQYDFPMFKGGRRLCLGKDMALFEMSVVAAMMLQKFTPETVRKPEDITYGPMKITLSVHDNVDEKDQLLMRMVPRN